MKQQFIPTGRNFKIMGIVIPEYDSVPPPNKYRNESDEAVTAASAYSCPATLEYNRRGLNSNLKNYKGT